MVPHCNSQLWKSQLLSDRSVKINVKNPYFPVDILKLSVLVTLYALHYITLHYITIIILRHEAQVSWLLLLLSV